MNRDEDLFDEAPAELEVVKQVSPAESRHVQTQRWRLSFRSKHYSHSVQISIPPRLQAHMITLEPILDLNNSVLAHRSGYPKVCDPISIVDGIKSNGEICTNFEFILFGVWLMIDSQPGLASSTGPAASINNVLRTVAAAAAMVWYGMLRRRCS